MGDDKVHGLGALTVLIPQRQLYVHDFDNSLDSGFLAAFFVRFLSFQFTMALFCRDNLLFIFHFTHSSFKKPHRPRNWPQFTWNSTLSITAKYWIGHRSSYLLTQLNFKSSFYKGGQRRVSEASLNDTRQIMYLRQELYDFSLVLKAARLAFLVQSRYLQSFSKQGWNKPTDFSKFIFLAVHWWPALLSQSGPTASLCQAQTTVMRLTWPSQLRIVPTRHPLPCMYTHSSTWIFRGQFQLELEERYYLETITGFVNILCHMWMYYLFFLNCS